MPSRQGPDIVAEGAEADDTSFAVLHPPTKDLGHPLVELVQTD